MASNMPRAKGKGKTQVTVLLDDDWVDRLDQAAARLSEEGAELTRADVLRIAIRRGLDQLDAGSSKPGKR